MFSNENYFNSVWAVVLAEEQITDELIVYCNEIYGLAAEDIMDSDLSSEDKILALASWEFPFVWFTYNSSHTKDDGLILFNKILNKEKLPPNKIFDGLIAKSIQTLRLHLNFSYKDFLE